jgi:general stress protein CsbA
MKFGILYSMKYIKTFLVVLLMFCSACADYYEQEDIVAVWKHFPNGYSVTVRKENKLVDKYCYYENH